jgi:hypothetical protein
MAHLRVKQERSAMLSARVASKRRSKKGQIPSKEGPEVGSPSSRKSLCVLVKRCWVAPWGPMGAVSLGAVRGVVGPCFLVLFVSQPVR